MGSDLSRLPTALLRFVAGRPLRTPVARALHRLLAGDAAQPPMPLDQLATAAHRGEVAVLASTLSPALAPHLDQISLRLRRHDALLELALAEVAPALDATAPIALLKGSAAAAWAYPETALRMRKDLDLLVGSGLPSIRAALHAHGWRDHLDPGASHDALSARAWPMARELGNTTVTLDLHRDLVHTPWCRPRVDLMLAERVPGRAALPVTTPVDTFLNTALHLVGSGFHEPLKGWIDLLRLLPLIPAATLATRARTHRLRTATWAVLGVLERWFAADVSAQRDAVGAPPHGPLIDHLLAGEHDTPERRPIPRGVAHRLWRGFARDI